MNKKIRNIIDKTLDFIYPKTCLTCNQVLAMDLEKYFCERCLPTIEYIDTFCEKCGKKIHKDDECKDCKEILHYFDKGRSLFVYKDEIKQAIIDYKYHQDLSKGKSFARLFYNHIDEINDWIIDVVVPVPLHKEKYIERGFNQSEIIAKELSCLSNFDYNNKSLVRVKNTDSQKSLKRADRFQNMQESFFVSDNTFKDKTVLLVDDVYTTGATIDSCAKALLDAEAKNVYFITVATGEVV